MISELRNDCYIAATVASILSALGIDKELSNVLDYECLEFSAPVAQLDRVADFESEGCRFESCRARCVTMGAHPVFSYA